MKQKKYTQFGLFSVLVIVPILVFFLYETYTVWETHNSGMILFSVLSITMVIALLFFYRLVIRIDDEYISFKFGIGLFGKKYRIDQLAYCKPVKNSPIFGIGIRIIPNGWLYNVTGFNAIDLFFKDRYKIIRIGTNKPDELAGLITGLISKENEYDIVVPLKTDSSIARNRYIGIAAVIAILVLFTLYGNQDVKIKVNEDTIEINGMYGGKINLSDISQADTLHWMPKITMKTNGYSLGSVCKGNFTIQDIGSSKLFINYKASPVIKLRLRTNEIYFINFSKSQLTISLYKEIVRRMNPAKKDDSATYLKP
jgi:hypothetical protein